MRARFRKENGAAVVEAPICIAIILLLAMGVLTITQVVWTHMDLATTARDASRYAGRAEWDPSAEIVTLDRYRTVGQIRDFAFQAGDESELLRDQIVVTVKRDDAPLTNVSDSTVLHLGDQVTVEILKTVDNPLYQSAASITNAVAGVFHLGGPFDEDGVDIKAKSSTYVE
jgi:hypothetical protein